MSLTAVAAENRSLLLQLVDEAYDRPTWNGPNLRTTLTGVKSDEAAWRPRGERRSIAEITAHCAYWKYLVRRRVTGDRGPGFPLRGRDWPQVPRRPTEAQWDDLLKILDEAHGRLRDVLADGRAVDDRARRQVLGVVTHDVYHTGQIRMIRAMYKRSRRRSS